MPDIANRAELEQKVADALKRLRGEQRARLLRYLGDPPDPSKVPESFWREIEDDDRELLLLLLLPISVSGARNLAKQLGIDLPEGTAELLVRPRVEQRAAQVARDAAANSRDSFAGLADRLKDQQQTEGDILAGIFGDTRAETQAITETTQANSLGEMAAVDAVRGGDLAPEGESDADRPDEGTGDGGRKGSKTAVELIWVTERDAAVCPLCSPLDGKGEDVWGKRYPDGPPAHPRCRCVLEVKGGRKDGQQFRAN